MRPIALILHDGKHMIINPIAKKTSVWSSPMFVLAVVGACVTGPMVAMNLMGLAGVI